MAEYIEREAVLNTLEELYDHHLTMRNYAADGATQDCINAVIDAPTADVVEVRRGWWAKKNVGFLKTSFCCSICGGWEHEYAYEHNGMNHCPNCGAKMDGKDDNDG